MMSAANSIYSITFLQKHKLSNYEKARNATNNFIRFALNHFVLLSRIRIFLFLLFITFNGYSSIFFNLFRFYVILYVLI